jgi:heptosyltransferase II
MQRILVIQTAFIGDVVLATALVEKIHQYLPDARIDFLVRKGNESLLANNPNIHEVLIWNKKENKRRNLFALLSRIRKTKYDKVINLQRFMATGILTAFSAAKETIGFDKNPLSFLFSRKVKHQIEQGVHEVQRNISLISHFTDNVLTKPKLYPSVSDHEKVKQYQAKPYITMTPSSVWFTKQYPVEKWIDFINVLPFTYNIYILGGKENIEESNYILNNAKNPNVVVLSGQLSFLQSAALMKGAKMNYVNDSAPLHFASAVNAPVTAIFCSTIPGFGFTPLSDKSFVIETTELLTCKPCGLHGKKSCPEGHFKCALTIRNEQLLQTLA